MAAQRADSSCDVGQVRLAFEDKGIKRFIWIIALVLASLGYLLVLVTSIFPFWVRLVNEESHEVFFSGLFEDCFHMKCLQPQAFSAYIFLGRIFLLSAVVLALLTTFFMVSFASNFFWGIQRPSVMSGFISFLTGTCGFLALLLHALEIRDLRMNTSHLQFSVQWPYYILGLSILLFLLAGAICLSQEATHHTCHFLPIFQRSEETQGTSHLVRLESLGGGQNSVQKGMLLQDETTI
ncbi:transmembrane protein 225B [Octodon degus]|uniref:Transmembrane protein 225B n=1 Tax=Octodon degus TaxID=10160 RepID=A0A6P3VAA3_OCTDE|nr:transmembrane protein 225B [Octodon degus]